MRDVLGATLLPTWAGWVGLIMCCIGCGLGGWMLGHYLERGRGDERRTDLMRGLIRAANDRITEEVRRAEKYRLAWLSARRRAHRGRLLAQLLREDADLPIWATTDPAAAHAAAKVGIVFDVTPRKTEDS